MMPLAKTEMSETNGAHGAESWNTTWFVPFGTISLMAKSRKLSGPDEFMRERLIENTTSSGVSGLPSENLTPGRRVKVKVLWSALTV